jgi:hypothetical protein
MNQLTLQEWVDNNPSEPLFLSFFDWLDAEEHDESLQQPFVKDVLKRDKDWQYLHYLSVWQTERNILEELADGMS